MTASGHVLALDVGGTFTDVVLVDLASGSLVTAKEESVPDDPSVGFFAGIDKILRRTGHSGTTLLESSGVESDGGTSSNPCCIIY